MADDRASPRLSPSEETALDQPQRELLSKLARPGASHSSVFLTLVRDPALFRRFIAYGGVLMYERLPERTREIAVLRVAVRCRSDYVWGQHVVVAREVGLTPDEVAAIAGDPDRHRWAAFDAAVIRAVDQLRDRADIDEPTWQTLAQTLDEGQLMALVLLVGHFHSVAFLVNAGRLPLDAGLEPLPPG